MISIVLVQEIRKYGHGNSGTDGTFPNSRESAGRRDDLCRSSTENGELRTALFPFREQQKLSPLTSQTPSPPPSILIVDQSSNGARLGRRRHSLFGNFAGRSAPNPTTSRQRGL